MERLTYDRGRSISDQQNSEKPGSGCHEYAEWNTEYDHNLHTLEQSFVDTFFLFGTVTLSNDNRESDTATVTEGIAQSFQSGSGGKCGQ